jgi:tRNA pseudouridine55 synthase
VNNQNSSAGGSGRMAVGNISIARAVTLDALGALPEEERNRYLLPPDALLQDLPEIRLDEAQSERFTHGNPVAVECEVQGKCRVYAESGLLGVGHADSGKVHPHRLLASR